MSSCFNSQGSSWQPVHNGSRKSFQRPDVSFGAVSIENIVVDGREWAAADSVEGRDVER